MSVRLDSGYLDPRFTFEDLDSSSDVSSSSDHSETSDLEAEQREWEENLKQLQLIVSVVLLPYIGKWLGRKWSFWLYDRHLKMGWSREFFMGSLAKSW